MSRAENETPHHTSPRSDMVWRPPVPANSTLRFPYDFVTCSQPDSSSQQLAASQVARQPAMLHAA